jgi:nucleoside-diphosphate-sugar epimerase
LVKIFDKDATLFHKINVQGTENMLEKSLESGVEKFVFTSSCSVIGPSSGKEQMCEDNARTVSFDNEYDITKFKAEKLVIDYAQKGLCTVIVCPSKVFGPGIETHPISVNTMIKKFIDGSPTFIPKPGSLKANYCFITDVVRGHILAMNHGTGGEKYILGGVNISFADFFQTVRFLSGTKARLLQTHKIFVKTWAALQWIQYKAINKEPYITEKGIRQIFCNKIFSSDKAIRDLGYTITPLRDSLQQTIHFLKIQAHV